MRKASKRRIEVVGMISGSLIGGEDVMGDEDLLDQRAEALPFLGVPLKQTERPYKLWELIKAT